MIYPGKSYTVQRQSQGSYVNGRLVKGAESQLTILASVQPASISKVKSLPEGRRESRTYLIFTETELKTVSLGNPDNVIIDNERYEVFDSAIWDSDDVVLDHNEYLAVRTIEQ